VRTVLAIIFAAAACAEAPTAPDLREIVRRSVSHHQMNWALKRQYTCVERTTEKEFDPGGKVKSNESKVYDVSILYDEPYERLIEKNGKPLSGKDDQKERDKLARFMEKRAHDTPEQAQKRVAKLEKEREKEVDYLREIPDAYDFRSLGEEKVDGKDTWVIQAEPHPGYQAKQGDAKYFAKIHGKIWIDKADYQWAKVDAETMDTISFGVVLFRLFKGSRLEFEQTRVNDEVWLPKLEKITAAGRLGLFKKASFESLVTFENFRKFQSDSKIVSASEVK
jgi:hypothetical protein